MSHKLGLRTRVAWAIFAFFILASTIVSRAIAALGGRLFFRLCRQL